MDFLGLIPSFGGLIWTIGAFIIALSIIVAIHEYGHYIVGRWSGIHAEVFSIGFGPVLTSRTDKRGTQWQIAALPFGGFVKFKGDANAASVGADGDIAELTPEERRATMNGAPLWARAATVFAGPLFNFILSVVLFLGLLMWSGVPSSPLKVSDLMALPTQHEIVVGDEILKVDGTEIDEVADLSNLAVLPRSANVPYEIRRDGKTQIVSGPQPIPAMVGGFCQNSSAEAAGLQVGDVILAVDGRPVFYFNELPEIVSAADGTALNFQVWRSGEVLNFEISPLRQDTQDASGAFETRWLIGIFGARAFDSDRVTPSISEAFVYGIERTTFIVTSTFKGIYAMSIGAISTCNISGPIGIAQVAGEAAGNGLLAFISLIAVLSTAVGLLNLFPIPVLDGGHLVFHAWEAVTGNPPSERALNILMTVGLGLMAMLMVFAITNDLFCP